MVATSASQFVAGCVNNAQARVAPAHGVGVYKEKSELSSRTFDQSSSEENESAFDAQNLTELVDHAYEIVLVFHHRVDALVGSRNFIKHTGILATHDAFGLRLEVRVSWHPVFRSGDRHRAQSS